MVVPRTFLLLHLESCELRAQPMVSTRLLQERRSTQPLKRTAKVAMAFQLPPELPRALQLRLPQVENVVQVACPTLTNLNLRKT